MKNSDLKWALLPLLVLTACGEDDHNGDGNPDGPGGEGTMEVMTPEESKTFLQNASIDFLNKFNPEEQKQVIDLAAYFSEEYGDFDAPDEFDIDDDGYADYSASPTGFIKAMANASNGDLDAMTRAAFTYSYTINFDKFAGIYEPSRNRHQWVKTGSSKDIVFRFTNRIAQPVELKITQSGGVSDVNFSEKYTDWDYWTGEEYEEIYNYYISIPKNVTATLTENGKQLANTNVVSSINIDGHTLSADVQASLMNIKSVASVNGTDTKVEASANFYVSGNEVANAYATVHGDNLCNTKKYESLEDMDDDRLYAELAKMFQKGNCGVDVLGLVQVYGQVNYYEDLPADLDSYYDNYDYDSQYSAQAACQKACDRLNKNVTTQLRYNMTATDQASLLFYPEFDRWGTSYWEYWIGARLLFPDGTTYDMDSYFDKFTNVSNKWETLIEAYEKIWDSARLR